MFYQAVYWREQLKAQFAQVTIFAIVQSEAFLRLVLNSYHFYRNEIELLRRLIRHAGRGNAMQPERESSCLLLMICAGIILSAGAAQTVYGAEGGRYFEKKTAETVKSSRAENETETETETKTEAVIETAKLQNTTRVRSLALRHWSLGDTVTRAIDGKAYRFHCIDQNYADHMDHHRKGALFLCDEVIPANFGSRYVFETPGDHSHDYVYHPGPIVRFGDNADYKYSAVRAWLTDSAENFTDAIMVNTGVERAYLGETEEKLWEQFPENDLTALYLGSQKMADPLFILSVDEAYRYRSWLWRFDGSKKRNPETQIGEFCKGYWLRTPCGSAEGSQIYIVDLVQGNIRPEVVRSDGQLKEQEENETTGADKEIRETGTTGVRPAFVLPQL